MLMHPYAKKLIHWYKQNKRDLPWRHTTNPYYVWLSEVILQQTRVEQGLPYYINFVKKYPSVEELAAAPLDDILKLWQGLGYYSRARNMHQTAIDVVINHHGKFPETYIELLKLKGVGPYTASAIASFSFNLPHPVLDGNVFRVISRIYHIETPINNHGAKEIFGNVLDELIPKKSPAIFNQAIMEFGSLQCKPTGPNCEECIFKLECLAFKGERVNQLPVKIKKAEVTKRFLNYILFTDNQRLWIQQRTGNDIWKNLYDLPYIETDELLNQDVLMEHPTFTNWVGRHSFEIISNVYMVHKLTHREIHAKFWKISVKKSFILNKNTIFETDFKKLETFAISRLLDKYLNHQLK